MCWGRKGPPRSASHQAHYAGISWAHNPLVLQLPQIKRSLGLAPQGGQPSPRYEYVTARLCPHAHLSLWRSLPQGAEPPLCHAGNPSQQLAIPVQQHGEGGDVVVAAMRHGRLCHRLASSTRQRAAVLRLALGLQAATPAAGQSV
jgi:hypothetical protein